MRSRESCIQRLEELSLREQEFSPGDYPKTILRAQMKGILFAMNDARHDSFKIPDNKALERED